MLLIFASNLSPEIHLFLNIFNMPKILQIRWLLSTNQSQMLTLLPPRGLGPDYAMLVTAIFNIPPLPSFPDLRARLLSFESQLTTIISSSNSSHPTAFVTTRGRGRGRGDSFRGGRAIRGDFGRGGRGSFFSNSGLLGPTPSSDFDGRRVQCQAKFWESLAILLSLVVFVTGPQLLTMISPTVSLACGLLTPMIPTGIRTLVRLII